MVQVTNKVVLLNNAIKEAEMKVIRAKAQVAVLKAIANGYYDTAEEANNAQEVGDWINVQISDDDYEKVSPQLMAIDEGTMQAIIQAQQIGII